jgi:carbon-monoxide dehydrogenase medium subunit
MYQFEYHLAANLADAANVLKKNPDAKLLAGGQTLLAAMKLRLASPSHLVDLSAIGSLQGVKVESADVVVGAMTRHAEVAASDEVERRIPALARLAAGIGDPMVRNTGTLGGSIANNDPAADYPAAVLGLAAVVRTDRRQIAADDFFTGMYETALQPGEIVTAVAFPVPKRAGYVKFKNPASRYAIAGVFVAQGASGVRVAVTGAGPCVFRVPAMEKALASDFSPDAAASVKIAAGQLHSDMHASAEYRAHLVTVIAKRAVAQALA